MGNGVVQFLDALRGCQGVGVGLSGLRLRWHWGGGLLGLSGLLGLRDVYFRMRGGIGVDFLLEWGAGLLKVFQGVGVMIVALRLLRQNGVVLVDKLFGLKESGVSILRRLNAFLCFSFALLFLLNTRLRLMPWRSLT